MKWVIVALLFLSGCSQDNGRILIIGDSISDQYTPFVQLAMPCVVHAPGETSRFGVLNNDEDAKYILDHMDQILSGGPYKIIHFNTGEHDFLEGIPLDVYKERLEEIVVRFQNTGAAVIFATTTPYPDQYTANNEAIAKYNRVALKVMKEHGVAVDDLYQWVQGQSSLHLQGGSVGNQYHWALPGIEFLADGVERSLNSYGGC